MIRVLLIFLILIFNLSYATEAPIQINIKYNEAQAKIEAFKNVEKKIDKEFYRAYLKDKNRKENLNFIENKIYEIDNERVLCPFYLQNTLVSYAIIYSDEPYYSFYYNVLGQLIKFDIVDKMTYPRRTLGYSKYGNLISVAFEVSSDEQFIYNENGKLTAHWVGDEAFDKDNKIPKILKLKRTK